MRVFLKISISYLWDVILRSLATEGGVTTKNLVFQKDEILHFVPAAWLCAKQSRGDFVQNDNIRNEL